MDINLSGIVVIVGNYGSGKTEVSINLAADRKKAGMDVRVADLDLVNPYFRTREARAPLAEMGIDVVLPNEEYLDADLPVLSPLVAGMLRRPSQLVILDVGGDGVGATVLASLTEPLKAQKVHVLQVVNPFRPATDSIAGCLKIKEKIEQASRLTVSGLVGNANLIDETTPADVYSGYAFVSELSGASGLPLEFVTAPSALISGIDTGKIHCPLLSIKRQMIPPWQKAASLSAGSFSLQRNMIGK